MIGSSVHGGLVFWISDSMFSTTFDVLIKISKVYRHQNLTVVRGEPRDVIESQAAHGLFLVGKWSTKLWPMPPSRSYGYVSCFMILVFWWKGVCWCIVTIQPPSSLQILPDFYECTKYIEIDNHAIHDKVLVWLVTTPHVGSSNQLVHILTYGWDLFLMTPLFES